MHINGREFVLGLETVDAVFSSLRRRLELGVKVSERGLLTLRSRDWDELAETVAPIVDFEKYDGIPSWVESTLETVAYQLVS